LLQLFIYIPPNGPAVLGVEKGGGFGSLGLFFVYFFSSSLSSRKKHGGGIKLGGEGRRRKNITMQNGLHVIVY
jgi:hypothetical protein